LATLGWHLSVDYDDSGYIGFAEFLEWMLTMQCGTKEQKLRFGFSVCDYDRSGVVGRGELQELLTSMFTVLSGLSLDVHNSEITTFVNQLFDNFDADRTDSLSWEQFKAACESPELRFETLLGHTVSQECETPVRPHSTTATARGCSPQEKPAPMMGSRLFFGACNQPTVCFSPKQQGWRCTGRWCVGGWTD
jgi:hypothetical protein